jgi:hypothetical protein
MEAISRIRRVYVFALRNPRYPGGSPKRFIVKEPSRIPDTTIARPCRLSRETERGWEMRVAASLYRLSDTMPVVEPIPVADTFALGLHAIEPVGPCVRFVFFTVQTLAELRHEPCRVITHKLVVPEASLLAGMHATMRFQGLAAVLAVP